MYNNDKKIIENKNFEMPAESVLEKARAALPEKKEKRRVNRKLIFAIASSFVVIIAVIVSIPYMMPANRALDFVYTSQMQAESIGAESAAEIRLINHPEETLEQAQEKVDKIKIKR